MHTKEIENRRWGHISFAIHIKLLEVCVAGAPKSRIHTQDLSLRSPHTHKFPPLSKALHTRTSCKIPRFAGEFEFKMRVETEKRMELGETSEPNTCDKWVQHVD
jgi:hypothetical protein